MDVGGVVEGFLVSISLVVEGEGSVVGDVVGDVEGTDVVGVGVVVGGVVVGGSEVVGVGEGIVDGGVLVGLVWSIVVSEDPPSRLSTIPCLRTSSFSCRSGVIKLAYVMVNKRMNTANDRRLIRENMVIEDV